MHWRFHWHSEKVPNKNTPYDYTYDKSRHKHFFVPLLPSPSDGETTRANLHWQGHPRGSVPLTFGSVEVKEVGDWPLTRKGRKYLRPSLGVSMLVMDTEPVSTSVSMKLTCQHLSQKFRGSTSREDTSLDSGCLRQAPRVNRRLWIYCQKLY